MQVGEQYGLQSPHWLLITFQQADGIWRAQQGQKFNKPPPLTRAVEAALTLLPAAEKHWAMECMKTQPNF